MFSFVFGFALVKMLADRELNDSHDHHVVLLSFDVIERHEVRLSFISLLLTAVVQLGLCCDGGDGLSVVVVLSVSAVTA